MDRDQLPLLKSVQYHRNLNADHWSRWSVKPYQALSSEMPDRFGSGQNRSFDYVPNPKSVKILDLHLSRKAQPFDQIWIGGGFDPYPRVEKQERITRRLFEVTAKHGCPAFVVTNSTQILRDIDLLNELNSSFGITVAFKLSPTFQIRPQGSCYQVNLSRTKIQALKRLGRIGIATGLVISPLCYSGSQTINELEPVFRLSSKIGLRFVLIPWVFQQDSVDQSSFNQYNYCLKPGKCQSNLQKPQGSSFHHKNLLVHNLRGRIVKSNSAKSSPKIKKFYRNLIELSDSYRMPLRMSRFLPEDYRKENYRLAENLADLAYYRQILGKSSAEYYKTASKLSNLEFDIRNLIRSGTLCEQHWLAETIKSKFTDLIEGNQNLKFRSDQTFRNLDWEWILA